MAAIAVTREIAFVNANGRMSPADFAFAVRALRIQFFRDFLPAWEPYLPVKRPMEVTGYNSTRDLAPGSFAPIEIVGALDRPGVLGDHGGFEVSDSAWGRSLPDSKVMSHEMTELAGDPFGNRWVRMPSGMVVALEVADPVENDSYEIEVTIAGETRSVPVSNFVYPAWFSEGAGRLDHMGTCTQVGENRGYLILEHEDGTTENVFASRMGADDRARVQAKLGDARTRTRQRHVKVDDRIRIQPGARIPGHWWT